MKRLLSLLVSLVIALNLIPVAFAATDEAVSAANALYEQGLFKGTGTNADGTPIFDLDKTPTRNQAIIMLVRLLGKENEALAGTYDIPFTDVSENMRPYIGYAYTNGLANGTSATTYSGDRPISANQYVSFVLRALGYESGVDFVVSSALTMSDKLGITNGQYSSAATFTRGDVAIISYRSLSVPAKNQPQVPAAAADNLSMGSLVLEEIHCERSGEARVGLKDAKAAKWETCCSEILITDYNESDCFIYVMSDASLVKHHYVLCTDSNGYKYICSVKVF